MRSNLCAVEVEDAPAIAARLQFGADTHALQFAGGQDDTTPLARILLDARDGASLLGTFEGFVAFKQFAIDAHYKLIAALLQFLPLALKLPLPLHLRSMILLPGILGALPGHRFLLRGLLQGVGRVYHLQDHLLLAALLSAQVLHLLLHRVQLFCVSDRTAVEALFEGAQAAAQFLQRPFSLFLSLKSGLQLLL